MVSDKSVGDILARYPGPVTLYSSRRKWLPLIIAALLLTLGGIGMAMNGDTSNWFGALFFGLCAMSGVAMLLPGASSLMLDADGFVMTAFFRRRRMRWQDTSNFEVGAMIPTSKYVSFDSAKTEISLLKPIKKLIPFHNAQLPDTYGLSAEELAALMTQWRERARSSL